MIFFFFNDTATTEICTLSLHAALPISVAGDGHGVAVRPAGDRRLRARTVLLRGQAACRVVSLVRYRDRKSTRLNSSHANISYAVFCLKKKKPDRTNKILTSRPSTISYA